MAHVSTYLNFPGNTEEAFSFYRSVFGGDFKGPVMRFGDVPPMEGQPPLSEADLRRVMHIELPILGGHVLMGCDALGSMGFHVNQGDSTYIMLQTDSREETDRLYAALTEGGEIEMKLQETFWGAYYASFVDRFGTRWMLNFPLPPA